MSQVVTQEAIEAGSSTGRVQGSRPEAAPPTVGNRLPMGHRSQRGLVTVEFIFGIILVIALITVVVSVIHNPAIGSLLVQLVSWLLGLIKGVKA